MKKILSFLLYGLFALAGIVTFYILSFRPILGYIHAQSWQQVPCQVTKSEVLTNKTSRRARAGSTFKINIEYNYIFQNKNYTGNKYQFIEFFSSGYDNKKNVIEAYPVGLQFLCYVNPSHPQESVIDRNPSWTMLLTLIPFPFLLVGFGGIYIILSKKEPPATDSTDQSQSFGPHNIRLQESMSAIKTFFITLFACAFWNICNVVMFYNWWLPVYQSQHSIPISNTLFFSIFVFAGLLLIYGVFYNFLCIFNPSITIEINGHKLMTGVTYNVNYKISGNTQRLKCLTISLIGNETVASGSGRNRTQTEFTAFESTILHEVSTKISANGEATFTINEEYMPSFLGKNNKIEWVFIVKGNIPFWPDMRHEFPVEIFPGV